MSDFTVYLAGEIHSDWRDHIQAGITSLGLNIEWLSPVTCHEDSDACGEVILGPQPSNFWRDRTSAGINAIRTRTAIENADLVVVRFGEQYRQWNAAFDAGLAVATGTPIITLHPESHDHALKEIDAAAQAVCRTPEEVVDLLAYVMTGRLARTQA